jgi:hypothetical protein
MIFGTEFDKAKIEKSKISVVLNYGGSVKVNNYLDSKYMYVKIYKNSELFFSSSILDLYQFILFLRKLKALLVE